MELVSVMVLTGVAAVLGARLADVWKRRDMKGGGRD